MALPSALRVILLPRVRIFFTFVCQLCPMLIFNRDLNMLRVVQTECQCDPGLFLNDYPVGDPRRPEGNFSCVPCPEGADCSNYGNEWSLGLAALPGLSSLRLPPPLGWFCLSTLKFHGLGWWRATNQSSTFYLCLLQTYWSLSYFPESHQ